MNKRIIFTFALFLMPLVISVQAIAIQMAVSNNASCVITDDLGLKCWGDNSVNLTLGYEDKIIRGDHAGTMGENLAKIDLGKDFYVKQVEIGGHHICALSTLGKVKCWGDSYIGTSKRTAGLIGLGTYYGVMGDQTLEMGDNLPYVDLGKGVVTQIAVGFTHTCALFDSGKVKCWGRNTDGQLGLGDKCDRGTSLSHMGESLPYLNFGTSVPVVELTVAPNTTCARFVNGSYKCWGVGTRYGYYPSDLGFNARSAGGTIFSMGHGLPFLKFGSYLGLPSKVVPGFRRTCGIFNKRDVVCWGQKFLGMEDSLTRRLHLGEARAVNLGADFNVVDITLAIYATCALSDTGKVKCWGGDWYDGYDVLGNGNT